jgi:hypothetical protein
MEAWQEAVARLKAVLDEYEQIINLNSRSQIRQYKTKIAEARINEQRMYRLLVDELVARGN